MLHSVLALARVELSGLVLLHQHSEPYSVPEYLYPADLQAVAQDWGVLLVTETEVDSNLGLPEST